MATLDYQPGDSSHEILRKILGQLATGAGGTVTLSVSDVEIGAVELKNGSDDTRATIFSRTNSNPVATQLVDSNGDPVSVGGGTQYSEDTAATAGEQIMMAGVVRQDVRASLVNADGDRTELQVNSSGDLRVDGSAVTQPISAVSLPLPTGAATQATLAAAAASLASIDGNITVCDTGNVTISAALPAGNNNIGDVDVASVPAPLNVIGGGVEAAALRVTIANDSTGVLSVDDNGGSLTVDTTQLPAALVGGRLDVVVGAALPAGTNNIGDVDVLSVPAPLNVTGGGLEATALRVTLASDSTGVLSVDDSGGSLTVDTPQLPAALVGGRLDVVVGAALPAGTNNIGDVDVLSVPAPLNLTGGGAEAAALRVTLADDSTGLLSVDDNGGSLTVDTTQLPAALVGGRLDVVVGAALPAGTNNIGDVDVLTVPAPLNVIGSGTEATALRVTIATDSTGVLSVDDNGASLTVDSTQLPAALVSGRLDVNIGASSATVPVSNAGTFAAQAVIRPETANGLTTFHLVSGASTNATSVKGSAGQLYGWYIYNSNASARKVAFHNTAGSPTAGASVFFSIVIPGSSGANVFSPIGIAFSSGIGITTVTGLADSDSAAVAANDLIINLFYS